MNLNLITTDVGRAAILDADQNGLTLRITHCAVGSTGWVPDGAATALVTEEARSPIASSSSDPEHFQVRVSALFDGGGEYWVREVGFFDENGVLVFIWSSETEALGYKSEPLRLLLGMVLTILEAPFDAITIVDQGQPLDITFAAIEEMVKEVVVQAGIVWERTDKTQLHEAIQNVLPFATETVYGKARFATKTEAALGVEDLAAVTPAGLSHTLLELGVVGALVTPAITSPQNGATEQALDVTVTATPFGVVFGTLTRAYRELQAIVLGGSWSNPAVQMSADQDDFTLSLSSGTQYAVRVRDVATDLQTSKWSDEITLQTRTGVVARPANVAPTDESLGVSATDTFQSSVFSATSGETHAQSNWRFRRTDDAPGVYAHETGWTAAHLLSYMPAGSGVAFEVQTRYEWQVRHRSAFGVESLWSVPTGFSTSTGTVNQPVNVAPAGGATSVANEATLSASAFSVTGAADTHAGSRWRVFRIGTEVAVYDSGEVADLVAHQLPPEFVMDADTAYGWQVQYRAATHGWSDWSAITQFSTSAQMYAIDTPVNASPADGSVSVAHDATLTASAFASATDTHVSSVWRVYSALDGALAHEHSSGADLVSYPLSVDPQLIPGQVYEWQVQYIGDNTASEWSARTSFTVRSASIDQPTNTSPADSATGIDFSQVYAASAFAASSSYVVQDHFEWEFYREATGALLHASGITPSSGSTYTLPPGSALPEDTSVKWRMRYHGSIEALGVSEPVLPSPWSAFTTVKTAAAAELPERLILGMGNLSGSVVSVDPEAMTQIATYSSGTTRVAGVVKDASHAFVVSLNGEVQKLDLGTLTKVREKNIGYPNKVFGFELGPANLFILNLKYSVDAIGPCTLYKVHPFLLTLQDELVVFPEVMASEPMMCMGIGDTVFVVANNELKKINTTSMTVEASASLPSGSYTRMAGGNVMITLYNAYSSGIQSYLTSNLGISGSSIGRIDVTYGAEVVAIASTGLTGLFVALSNGKILRATSDGAGIIGFSPNEVDLGSGVTVTALYPPESINGPMFAGTSAGDLYKIDTSDMTLMNGGAPLSTSVTGAVRAIA